MLTAGVAPAGLGARDTLRLEAGLPLHGHELGPGITPLQAGLGWVVRFDKGDFRGRAALAAERDAGPARACGACSLDGKRPPRADQSVVDADGAVRRRGHQRQLLPDARPGHRPGLPAPRRRAGHPVAVDVRGRHEPAEVVTPPFVTS